MKDVWAVTTGAYSDYHVVAIFESEETARAAAAALDAATRYESYDVETFPFYEQGDDASLVPSYIAHGQTPSMEVSVSEEEPDLPDTAPLRPKVTTRPWKGEMRITAVSRDRDAAIKAVKDRLAAAKAGADLLGEKS